MTTRRDNQPLARANASWADVIRASESRHEPSFNVDTADVPGEALDAIELLPGDTLVHTSFGRCTVHSVAEGIIHMAKESGRVIRVRQDMLPIRALGVETLRNNKTRRIFTTSTEQL